MAGRRWIVGALVAVGIAADATAALAEGGGAGAERDALFEKAKAIYAKRDSLMVHKDAAEAFAGLAERYPDDKELQIWCARTAYYAAHRIEDSKLRKKVSDRGVVCAKRVTERKADDYDGRFWWIMCRYKGEQASSMLRALDQAPVVRNYLAKMVKDAPSRPEAYMVLGAVYRGLPGPPVSFGDKAKALELLKKADELAPKNAEILLELAGGYADVGETEKARAAYRECIDHGTGPADLAWETRDAREYAKKMLAELD